MDCLKSVDGTDLEICEPWPYDKATNEMWYRHKINKAEPRYEVGIGIVSGDIVWVNVTFQDGSMTYNKIFDAGL